MLKSSFFSKLIYISNVFKFSVVNQITKGKSFMNQLFCNDKVTYSLSPLEIFMSDAKAEHKILCSALFDMFKHISSFSSHNYHMHKEYGVIVPLLKSHLMSFGLTDYQVRTLFSVKGSEVVTHKAVLDAGFKCVNIFYSQTYQESCFEIVMTRHDYGSSYVAIPKFLYTANISFASKLIYSILYTRFSDRQNFSDFAASSYSDICKFGFSRQVTAKSLKELTEKGFISVSKLSRKAGVPSLYILYADDTDNMNGNVFNSRFVMNIYDFAELSDFARLIKNVGNQGKKVELIEKNKELSLENSEFTSPERETNNIMYDTYLRSNILLSKDTGRPLLKVPGVSSSFANKIAANNSMVDFVEEQIEKAYRCLNIDPIDSCLILTNFCLDYIKVAYEFTKYYFKCPENRELEDNRMVYNSLAHDSGDVFRYVAENIFAKFRCANYFGSDDYKLPQIKNKRAYIRKMILSEVRELVTDPFVFDNNFKCQDVNVFAGDKVEQYFPFNCNYLCLFLKSKENFM